MEWKLNIVVAYKGIWEKIIFYTNHKRDRLDHRVYIWLNKI